MVRIYAGFVLTLLASLLVVLAGVILSRRSITETTQVNRVLMNELLAQVEKGLQGWDEKRVEQFKDLAFELSDDTSLAIEERLQELSGVRGAYFFRKGRSPLKWLIYGRIGERSPAEVIQQGRDYPLHPDRAVIIPKDLFAEVTFGQSGTLENKEGSYEAWWFSPLQGEVVLFLVKSQDEDRALISQLQEDLSGIWSEVEGTGEAMVVTVKQRPFLGAPPEDRPATIKKGNSLFMVMAWDQTTTRQEFHWPTMNSAIALSLLIAALGVFALGSQRRMWRRSQEQVSFANRVSHELGTPLTNMTLNLELAARALPAQPGLASERIDKVQEEVFRLGRLVKNVLTYSGKTKEVSRDSRGICDPDEVVGSAIDQLRPSLKRRVFQVDWTPGGVLEKRLDRDGLSQIVWNLISNVEKYGAEGKWLGVTTEMEDSKLVVEVMDRGPGIPNDQKERIFDSFERLQDSTREGVSGTGLGLSISRELARTMGGTLECLDRNDLTVFRLTIPCEIR
jgi:signal transduction histidine kinase